MRPEEAGRLAALAPLEILREILSRLPESASKTVASVGPSPRAWADLARLAGRADVVLADGTRAGDDLLQLDAALLRARHCLTEGGLLAAAFLAAPRGPAAREMRLRIPGRPSSGAAGLHEVELQYRLQRAGFRGARIVRVTHGDGTDCLLCLAVRRADN